MYAGAMAKFVYSGGAGISNPKSHLDGRGSFCRSQDQGGSWPRQLSPCSLATTALVVLRLHLQRLSPGRIFTTFLYPEVPNGMTMNSKQWAKVAGVT